MTSPAPPEPRSSRWLLRRADQAAIAGLTLFALGAMAYYWIAQGGLRGRLIEIDRVDPLSVQYQVDLNTADKPELVTLPEIGDTLAQHILDYRRQHGPFQAVDDLRRVRGFGAKTMERLRPYLRVSAPGDTIAKEQAPADAAN
jgi:competence ComEA-like helix-hairpin-helix protein